MNLREPLSLTNLERHPTSREGITCVVCHRVNKNYGKVSGRLAPIFTPVQPFSLWLAVTIAQQAASSSNWLQ